MIQFYAKVDKSGSKGAFESIKTPSYSVRHSEAQWDQKQHKVMPKMTQVDSMTQYEQYQFTQCLKCTVHSGF